MRYKALTLQGRVFKAFLDTRDELVYQATPAASWAIGKDIAVFINWARKIGCSIWVRADDSQPWRKVF